MKIVALLLFFNAFFICYSQKGVKEIYLFIDKNPVVEVKNDTLLFQKFVIDFNENSKNKEINLSIDKERTLIKSFKIKPSNNRNLNLVYRNEKNHNIPIIVQKKDIKNVLFYNEIIESMNSENFSEIVSKFDLYLIEKDKDDKEYFIAKKVVLEKLSGL
ncbi:hypothetical protein [Flavobacterium sp. HNIBRBA15423]|uniref:hypothetical protein n=1 Tax=Flavobacterium sp. HNIBRBA15423 TaxID=3458683 RepID=UPI004044E3F7